MFGINKKHNIVESGLLRGMVDTHSHVIDSVDDGSKSIEQSNTMIRALREAGISRSFCTPHIKADMPHNTPSFLGAEFDRFRSEVADREFGLRLAAEYMIDEQFKEQIEKKSLLTYDGQHVLIEMSYLSRPKNRNEILFELHLNGYSPILAHPERYLKFETADSLRELKEKGCKLQLNLGTLSNAYGESVRRFADELLAEDLYDFLGTDIHNPLLISYIREIKVGKKQESVLRKLIENNSKLWRE